MNRLTSQTSLLSLRLNRHKIYRLGCVCSVFGRPLLGHELLAIAEAAFAADRPVALLVVTTCAQTHAFGLAPADVGIEFGHGRVGLRLNNINHTPAGMFYPIGLWSGLPIGGSALRQW